MEQPLISVIIPVYKVEKHLDRCLESVVNQTYRNLEIILVDDGSPDNCPAMCDAWAKKDSRIKVIHKENAGVAMARNDALDIASGEYIGFVDSDDFIELNMYELLSKVADKYCADVVVCQYDASGFESGTEIVDVNICLQKIALGNYCYGVLWNKLYSAEVVKNHRIPNLKLCEDMLFNYYVFKSVRCSVFHNQKLYHYCNNGNSVSHGAFTEIVFDTIKARLTILNGEVGTDIYEYALNSLVSSIVFVLYGCINKKLYADKVDELILLLKQYKKDIIASKLISKRDKLKVCLFCSCKPLYAFLIRRKYSHQI